MDLRAVPVEWEDSAQPPATWQFAAAATRILACASRRSCSGSLSLTDRRPVAPAPYDDRGLATALRAALVAVLASLALRRLRASHRFRPDALPTDAAARLAFASRAACGDGDDPAGAVADAGDAARAGDGGPYAEFPRGRLNKRPRRTVDSLKAYPKATKTTWRTTAIFLKLGKVRTPITIQPTLSVITRPSACLTGGSPARPTLSAKRYQGTRR